MRMPNKLATTGKVDLRSFVTRRLPLRQTGAAFEMCANYQDNVLKAVILS
jgi:hypothetical protein